MENKLKGAGLERTEALIKAVMNSDMELSIRLELVNNLSRWVGLYARDGLAASYTSELHISSEVVDRKPEGDNGGEADPAPKAKAKVKAKAKKKKRRNPVRPIAPMILEMAKTYETITPAEVMKYTGCTYYPASRNLRSLTKKGSLVKIELGVWGVAGGKRLAAPAHKEPETAQTALKTGDSLEERALEIAQRQAIVTRADVVKAARCSGDQGSNTLFRLQKKGLLLRKRRGVYSRLPPAPAPVAEPRDNPDGQL